MANPKTSASKPAASPRTAPVTDWGAILRAAAAHQPVSIELDKQPFTFTIRALTGVEWEQAEAFADIEPPMSKGADGMPEFDFENADYIEKRKQGARLKTAYLIDTGLVDLSLEGDTIEAKSEWLRNQFPINLRVFLEDRITALSANPIPLANFSTSGD